MIECRIQSYTNAGLNPIFNKTSNNIHNQAKKKKRKGANTETSVSSLPGTYKQFDLL